VLQGISFGELGGAAATYADGLRSGSLGQPCDTNCSLSLSYSRSLRSNVTRYLRWLVSDNSNSRKKRSPDDAGKSSDVKSWIRVLLQRLVDIATLEHPARDGPTDEKSPEARSRPSLYQSLFIQNHEGHTMVPLGKGGVWFGVFYWGCVG